MRRDSRFLKSKAISSLRRAVNSFNGLEEDGRLTSVLLHAQHAAEMLTKATLCEKNQKILDPATGRSVGFKKCINLAREHINLSSEAAGTLRAIGALRDDEQHYLGGDDEGILYVHLRALVTLFDEILQSQFGESLADHLPSRMLPISTMPPEGIDILIDREFSQIQDLLRPNLRRRPEARGKIRTLLAMEAHSAEDVDVSERDVNRVEAGIRTGLARDKVFPRLNTLTSVAVGEGVQLKVHFSRKDEGAPVRFIAADDPREAAAVREVDLEKKYPHSRSALAQKLKTNTKQAKKLREKLAIDEDPDCLHIFVFNATRIPMYSDLAFRRLREALTALKKFDAGPASSPQNNSPC